MFTLAGVEDVVIAQDRQQLYVTEHIVCSSNAYPTPSYTWANLDDGSVTCGQVLILTNEMIGFTFTFQCTATNFVNGKQHNASRNTTVTVLPGIIDQFNVLTRVVETRTSVKDNHINIT